MAGKNPLPREIASGIFWLGGHMAIDGDIAPYVRANRISHDRRRAMLFPARAERLIQYAVHRHVGGEANRVEPAGSGMARGDCFVLRCRG